MLGGSPFSLLDTGDAKLPTALRRTQEFESRGDVFASAWHGARLQVVFPLRCLAFLAQVSSGAAAASSLQLFLGYFTRVAGQAKPGRTGTGRRRERNRNSRKKKEEKKKNNEHPRPGPRGGIVDWFWFCTRRGSLGGRGWRRARRAVGNGPVLSMNHWGRGGLRESDRGPPNLASDSGQRCSFESAIWARGRGPAVFGRKSKVRTVRGYAVRAFWETERARAPGR